MKNLFLNAALIRTTRWCGAVTAMQTHLVRMALAVFCLALTGASALGQTATDGDYRTLATGNWSSSSTWQVRSGGTWATASSAPTSANSIYIQTGHTVTVDSATVACKDLQMGGGVLAIGTNTVQVNGKLRGYTLASAVTSTADGGLYTAANLTNPTGITSTAATGYLSIVGNTRTLTFTGEWGANLSTVDTSIDLNAGQTVTMQTSHKSRNWKFNTGTYDAGTFRIAADDGSGTGGVGHGDVTIASGATVISAATGTGTSAVFGQTGSRSAGTLTLNSGATLKLNGAAPGIAMGAVTFNGTVEYGAAGAQTLAVVLNSGAGPTNYTNLKLSGSGTKTLGANTTVTDTLTMAGGTLALSTFALNYGGSSTLEYAGSAQQTTATTEFPASAGPNSLKINNASGVKLGAARTVASTLTLAAGAFDLNGNTFAANTLASSGSITNSGAATTLTVGGSGGSSSFGGVISGALALTKSGAGTLTLTAANTYSGNTTVSAGTLALSGSGSVASTPNITVAAGATFDVSAVSSALTLGSSQTLTASGSGSVGTLATTTGAGLTLGSTGPLQFTAYDGVNAPLTVSGAGSLTLAAGNAVTVTVNGTALVAGDYKLVSKGSGNTTAVNGTAPTSVTVNGTGGLGSGLSGSLVITAGELFLHVASGTAAPTVTSSAATSISTTAATLNGNVTSDGGATVSERGFVYKTSTGVTITDNKNTVAGTTGAYSLGVSSLAVNTQYFFKAYAINAAGTTLSSELNFWTLANAPSAPTVSGATATTLQVAVNANGNPAGTLFAIHETTQNKYVQADGTLNTSAVYQTAATWGTKTVTGLTTLTTYTFEVKAQNGGGTDTAFSATANGTTTGSSNADLSALVVNTGPLWLSPTFASGTTNYTVYPDHSTNSITITPTLADTNATIKVNGTTVVSGATSGAISLVDGTNIITVLVTAQDAVTTKTNTIYAIRSAAPLPTGAIAFVGFNADGNDDVAFVALTNLPANTVIHFTDNGWNGSAIGSGGTFNFTESEWVWIAPNAGLAAGTIVAFTNINAGILTPTVGTAEFADAANRGLSTSAETVYAFQGASHAPTVFLAGLTTESATNFNNTGLTTNVTAVVLSSSSDGGSYKGARTGQATFDGYLALIGDVANNWNDVGNGDGTTLLPFSSTAFTASAYDANVSINDVSITEGDAGTKTLTFTVTRSTSAGAFTVDYTTTNGTATTANSDYVATNGTLTFTAGGSLTQIIGVTINGDTTPEADETFFVNLTNVVNSLGTVTLTMSQGTGTILNDDPIAPSFTSLPSNQTIPTGSATTLSVTASGTPAPTYQWYVGTSGTTTSPIANATNASYTTSVLLATTSYWVRVTNSAGTADSSTAVLTTSYQTPYASTNLEVYAPNTAAWNPAGVTNNGTVFINLGLQGMGRVPASTIDPVTGESLGSVSDLQITGWKKNTNGSYSGTLNTLPDRGYNNGATFSNYGARINKFDFTFTPYTNSTPTSAQNQIALTFAGSTRFTYDNGSGQKFTTGLPADGTLSLFGTTVPVASGNSIQSDGTVTNRLTLDSEGLALDRRAGKSGAGWIGDEYGASIYHFNSSKQIDGQLILPAALIPHNPVGTVNFNGTPVNGRRDNQGVEGLAQSPDGTRLFALMQSATIQDTGSGNQGRYNTRLLVYDISSTDTPNDPIAQYVIQLPRIDTTGSTTNGTTVDKVGAQSSIVALSTNQILILSRDGNGRGSSGSPVFKSILLADLSSASNIDGTYDAEGDQVAPGGTLRGSIVPLAWTEALNMVGKLGATTAEVEKFGLNLNPAPGDTNTISEKWEALSMVSANDPTNPNDYFLFVGNDNDFLSRTGKYLDASGTIQTYDAGLENDTLFLVWRVRMTSSFNQAPFVANAIADQTAVATVPFTLTFPTNTFVDPEGQTLTYTATMSDDTALPSWLTFNAGTRTFSGTPASGDAGTLTVKVTATDNGSPNLFGSLTFNITTSVDSTPPTISIGSPSVSLTNTGAVTYTVTYADANFSSSTLANGNITLNKTGTANGSVAVTGSGTTRTVTISSITGDGTLGISIAAGTASDTTGNLAPAAGPSTTFTVDNTAPTISIGSPSVSSTTSGPVTYTVTYADANFSSSTLANGNITLNKTGTANGSVAVTGSGTTRTVTISSITGDGTLGISIAAGTASDTAGNTAAAAGPSTTFTVDNTAPTVTISAPSVGLTNSGVVTYTVTYADANFSSSTLATNNLTLNKTGTANGNLIVTGTGTTRTVAVTNLTGDGTLSLSIAAGTASDTAGNLAPAAGPSAVFVVGTYLGIAAGDADATSVMLWTRLNQAAALSLTAQVATNTAFTGTVVSYAGTNDLTRDSTVKIGATNLTAGTRYYYRFVLDGTGETSATGTFKTAPATNAAVAVKFGFSGDMDGLMRPYALASTLPALQLDFYANLGDVIYENASVSTGNNGASWLNSPSVTLSGDSASLNGVPTAGTTFATKQQLFDDYNKKYREQFLPVNVGGQFGLKDFYAGQANYTFYDNHELGNRQYINGGAPAGGSVGGASGTDMPTGRGVDARNNGSGNVGNTNDVNSSASDYMNRAQGFLTLQNVFLSYQPVKENRASGGVISAPSDPRTDGTKQLYFAQQWGRNALYVQVDDRTYRDLRLKTANGGADDTGTRAANTNRTILGATQLAWLKSQLLAAQAAGVPWKFIAISDPIDQIGPIGSSLTNVTAAAMSSYSSNASYSPVNSDGGKSWMGGYRAERNALLKFIADNGIQNVVFLATDDHQNRINELTYAPDGDTETQSKYVKVPYCFSIVCGPLGATGPDLFLNHAFAGAQGAANLLTNAQVANSIEPIGLVGYPGLKNVQRDVNGTLTSVGSPEPADFYSPDTFNYNTLDVSADGKTLTVTSVGINATAQNSAGEYSAGTNAARTVFTFQIDAPAPTITSVTGPTGGSYRAGQTLTFTVNFSTPVTVTGTPRLALTIGSTSTNASYVSGSGSTALVFTYTVQAGDVDADGIAVTSPLTLNGGSIVDVSSTAAVLTFTPPITTTVLVDTTAPSISIGSPSVSLTNTGAVTYTVTYTDANFSSSTLANGNVTLNKTGTANGSVAVTGSGTTRTVTISSITGDGTLGISIAAGTASDTAGNTAPAAGPSTTFTVDNTAPSISIGSPSVSSTTSGPVTYTVTYADANFSSSTLANGNITLNKTGTANGSVAVTGSGTTRTVTISSITGTGSLGISVAAGTASDTAGNTAAAAGPSTTFTVTAATPDIVIYLTGSTAFRSVAYAAIASLYNSGFTVNAANGSGSPFTTIANPQAPNRPTADSLFNEASFVTFSGTMPTFGSQVVAVYCNWGGSVAGLRDVAQQNTRAFLSTSLSQTSAFTDNGTNAVPDFCLSDVNQTTTVYKSPTLQSVNFAVVPYVLVKNNGASGTLTNITHQQAQTLFANGVVSLGSITGDATTGTGSDTNKVACLIGANNGSGGRALVFADTGYGALKSTFNYKYDGTNTFVPVVPDPNVGYTSVGSIRADLSVSASQAIGADGSTTVTGYALGYLSVKDAYSVTGNSGGALNLQYDGSAFSTNAVQNGTYTLWGYERISHRSGINANLTSFRGAITNALISNLGTGTGLVGIPLQSMKVQRSVDGGPVSTLY